MFQIISFLKTSSSNGKNAAKEFKNDIFFTLFNLQRVKTKHESNFFFTQLLVSIKFPKLNLKYLTYQMLTKLNESLKYEI